ncbi:MAG TPA: hypothetical protein VIA62_06985 [Thermoanaerobaculia bacterium]|jgi:hypothetical protein|nr:hypothetical protein [Thermoanaerobaculia bacterium]
MRGHLHGLFDGTLNWLTENLEQFDLPQEEDDRLAGNILIDKRRKAFGELALALLLLNRFRFTRRCPERGRILDYVATRAQEPYFAFDMIRRPNLFPLYLMVLLALEANGRILPGFRKRLQRVLDFGFIDALERTPWNQIDLRYYLDLAGLRHSMPNYASLYRLSSASRFPALTHLRNIDVYALTHIIFHLADFGRQDLRPILAERFAETRDVIGWLLGLYVHRGNGDLVAELLICCRCLEFAPATFHSAGWACLAALQTGEGDIPDCGFALSNLPESAGAAARQRFLDNYHPTLVTLLAAILELGRAET